MPRKEQPPKVTYNTLTEVGDKLEELMKKFDTFSTEQETVMDNKMQEVQQSTHNAFLQLSTKLDTLKEGLKEITIKTIEEIIKPEIKELSEECSNLKKKVELLENRALADHNMKKMVLSSKKIKRRIGKTNEVILECLPNLKNQTEMRYTSEWLGDGNLILMWFASVFDKNSFIKEFYKLPFEDRKSFYISDFIPGRLAYPNQRIKVLGAAMKEAKLISAYRAELMQNGSLSMVVTIKNDDNSIKRIRAISDEISEKAFPTINFPPSFTVNFPTLADFEAKKKK